jgi:phage recombination protein Bet
MSTALAIHQDAPVALAAGTFSREQMELLKRTVAAGTSDDEFALFAEVCRSTGLNPFQRQIYAIMRQVSVKDDRGNWSKQNRMTIQTGIDGYRLIAARTGLHAGTSDAEYGPESDKGWPQWARVTVRKLLPNGGIADFTATARWDEYVQTTKDGNPSGQWPKMPYLMLAKCAEALALRKAFPAELSGVYTSEEMSQADSVPAAPAKALEPAEVEVEPTQEQCAELVDLGGRLGDEATKYVEDLLSGPLTYAAADKALRLLRKRVQKAQAEAGAA